MSPLFSCSGCGVQIERSTRFYLEQRGRVLCSTCKDRLEAAEPPLPPDTTAGRPGETAPAHP